MRGQVFGVTRDPFIIWTSNMFAIASLRALYGLVANVLAELRFLEKAIAIVLAWIGAKMIIEVRGACCMAAAALASTRLQALEVYDFFCLLLKSFSCFQRPALFCQRCLMEASAAHVKQAVRVTFVMHASLKLLTHSVGLTGGRLPNQHGAEPGRGSVHAKRGCGCQPAAARGAGNCGRGRSQWRQVT